MGTLRQATSRPVYVTWDEWTIVSDLVTELVSAITEDSSYTTAQTALLLCMNPSSSSGDGATGAAATLPRFESFNDILWRYDNGDTGCDTASTTMFTVVRDLSRSKLEALRRGDEDIEGLEDLEYPLAVYADLLQTPDGRRFEARFEADERAINALKQDAAQIASIIAVDSIIVPSGGAIGSSDVEHGFEHCLPSDADPDLNVKFGTLNCLLFGTPHSRWVALHADSAKQTAFKNDLDMDIYPWLDYDNFACSVPGRNRWPAFLLDPANGLPCIKHDVAYASLQRIIEDGEEVPDRTLDSAWNPRNKYLADYQFIIDSICGMEVGQQRRECVPEAADDHGPLVTLFHVGYWMPKVYHHAVYEFNDKNWPLTEQDVTHAKQNLAYISCDVPRVSNVVIEHRSGRTFETTWTLNQGCVQDITVHSYEICFDVAYSNAIYRFLGASSACKVMEVSASPGRFTAPPGASSVTLVSMRIRPDDRVNDRLYYPEIVFTDQGSAYQN